MIGLSCRVEEQKVAEEFFELFKTPWEPALPGRKYRVILASTDCHQHLDAEVFLVYSSRELDLERHAGIGVERFNGLHEVLWRDGSLPIYGQLARFIGVEASPLTSDGKPIDYSRQASGGVVRRIGYDLFREVNHLLSVGQPETLALVPTLEQHIAVLRTLLQEAGISFVEIPPRPDGFDFICCLTHDVDFFGIRRHLFDRTLAGFAIRASAGTAFDFLRGRRPLTEAIHNWVALLSLPLVLIGLLPDLWRPFDDYARVEKELAATFFLVPFKGQPGVAPDGSVDQRRAVSYQISEIREDVVGAADRRLEFAVHGLDAWRDEESGRKEMKQLATVTGQAHAGVRMHWLYFAAETPRRLEAAGFDYDSTWGYNGAVGYRAGTSQVFGFPGTERLLELPLSIMDTALFYRGRMHLTTDHAAQQCQRCIATAKRYGGTLVINWHDRSLAPERLWGRPYKWLLEQIRTRERAWFATASETVNWFRWRRSIRFREDRTVGTLTVAASDPPPGMPGAVLRVHRMSSSCPIVDERSFDGRETVTLPL